MPRVDLVDVIGRLNTLLAGRYEVEKEIGLGGMGAVYLARDLRHDRPVAIKVLKPELAAVVGAERFLGEIRITASLQHPHLVPLFDSGAAGDLPFFVMPLIEGESLRARLDRERQLTVDDAIAIAAAVGSALEYVHRHGVVHRDLKPENILIQEGAPLVADFGIARAISSAGRDRLTRTGVSIGTPQYMSPEQATGEGVVDARTDVYALAAVTYEMLTGEPPHSGATSQVIVARLLAERPRPVREVRRAVPRHVEAAIARGLEKSAADRWPSAQAFVNALADADSAGPVRGRRIQRVLTDRRLRAGAMILGVTTVALATRAVLGRGEALPRPVSFTQLTSDPGVEWFPSISPDGEWLVYSGDVDGNLDIYLRAIGGENPIDLTPDSPADDDEPVFSPDGNRIAFRSERDGGGLYVMGRTGEAPRRVTDRGFHPGWSPDGREIVFATDRVDLHPENTNTRSELWIATLDGAAPRRLISSDAVLPSWSPHGDRIAFVRRVTESGGRPANGEIWTIRPDGTGALAAVNDPSRDWNPAWSGDGRYLYFVSDRGGSMNLWRIPIDERSGRVRGTAQPVTTPAQLLAHPSISADGRRIVYTNALITQNIQSLPFDPARGTIAGEPEWVTTGTRQWSSPDPSPDGRQVVFYSLKQPEGHLYIARPGVAGIRQLTADSIGIDRVPRWSPTGEWIAFFSNRAGPLQVWKIHPDGSGLDRVSDLRLTYVSWSADGSRMATAIGGPDSSAIIFTVDGSRPPERLSSALENIKINDWSRDGETLVGQIGAVGSAGRGIGVYSLHTGGFEKITDFGEWPVWLPDSHRILFVANGNAFFVADARTKEVRQIYSTHRDVLGPPRLTRDGRTAFFSRRVTMSDIWMVTLR